MVAKAKHFYSVNYLEVLTKTSFLKRCKENLGQKGWEKQKAGERAFLHGSYAFEKCWKFFNATTKMTKDVVNLLDVCQNLS